MGLASRSGWRSGCRNSPRAEWARDWIPVEKEILRARPDRPLAPPSFLYRVFYGGKTSGTWRWFPPPTSTEVAKGLKPYNRLPSSPAYEFMPHINKILISDNFNYWYSVCHCNPVISVFLTVSLTHTLMNCRVGRYKYVCMDVWQELQILAETKVKNLCATK